MVLGQVMLREVVAGVALAWGPIDIEMALVQLVTDPKRRMSIALDACCLTVPLMMPLAVELSVWSWVAGCSCPISVGVVHSTVASFASRNKAQTSSLAAEEMTLRRILVMLRMGPSGAGLGLSVRLLRK
jgi:hypothetical protein